MPYNAEISRSNPTAFLFLIDQSGSMNDRMINGKTIAQWVADVMNRTLMNLITRCTKAEGTRDYFDVGIIGYGGRGVLNGLSGSLADRIFHPISELEANPLRLEERVKKEDDGAGGILERKITFPVWFEAEAYGGTPMCHALVTAAGEIVDWCDKHPDSYPPTILHLTDGEANDGDPEDIGKKITTLSTEDGSVLFYNLHTTVGNEKPIIFPNSEDGLPRNKYAEMLFNISSILPEHLNGCALEKGYPVKENARGYMYNADAVAIADFFDIGTRAAPSQER